MKSSIANGDRSSGSAPLLILLPALLALLAGAGCATGSPSSGPRSFDASAGGAAFEPADSLAGETDAAPLVAEALEACESAEVLWQQGDFEGALATLDLAYELLLQIPDEPSLLQQKDDLRHLISRRVVEIYRSQMTTMADLNSPIPLEINEHVEREIKRFTGPERQFFLESYQRSGLHRPMIVQKLREAGLPEELSWLPLVESGFKLRALSSARALGMWQFISSTGSRYGLARNHWIDERMDPEKSTDAAIQYLTDLHGMFGDWTTALASYNCGENRVKSLIRRQQDGYLDGFWDVFSALPSETARYVPRFLATLAIVRNPEAYGMDLPEPYPAIHFETLTVNRHLRLSDLDAALGLERDALVGLNPELRRGTTPGDEYVLRVPSAVAASFDARVAALPAYQPPPEVTFAAYRVRRGDTLSTIARRYRTTVSAIMRANELSSSNRIREGQRLKIPQRGGSLPVVAAGRSGGTANARSYEVRPGDTIGRIARAENVSVERLLRTNGLSRSSTIYPGQMIDLPN